MPCDSLLNLRAELREDVLAQFLADERIREAFRAFIEQQTTVRPVRVEASKTAVTYYLGGYDTTITMSKNGLDIVSRGYASRNEALRLQPLLQAMATRLARAALSIKLGEAIKSLGPTVVQALPNGALKYTVDL